MILKTVEFAPRYFNKWNFCSSFKNSGLITCVNNFHTSENKNDPIKYTASKAEQTTVTSFITSTKTETLWYQKYVVLGSFCTFLLYFLFLREENDIDEMLKGDQKLQDEIGHLFDLEIKLRYCKKNNLPTEKLSEKIKILKKQLNIKDWD